MQFEKIELGSVYEEETGISERLGWSISGERGSKTNFHLDVLKIEILDTVLQILKDIAPERTLCGIKFRWLDYESASRKNGFLDISSFSSKDIKDRTTKKTYIWVFCTEHNIDEILVYEHHSFNPKVLRRISFVRRGKPITMDKSVFLAPVGKFRVVEIYPSGVTMYDDSESTASVIGDYGSEKEALANYKKKPDVRAVVNDRAETLFPKRQE